ncbi:MAG: spore coat protein CotJB [Firmicutes bacterium]|jgi:spore coat protein JB|nr:spore coat protein CotJB [Bacillota bacterium]MDD4336428.1 spore coat protein CotJB [Bacillota bacterium]MDD4792026.1 spore coat protein CotJB [Bacillota bacterium]
MRPPVNREELLLRIQALEFTGIDLGLYLNTHPNDTRALADYNQISAALAQTRAAYEQAFGPLMNFGQSQSRCRWAWVDEPWPWEV